MVFTEKCIRMSGTDKQYFHRSIQHLLHASIIFGGVLHKQYALHHSKYIALSSLDTIADGTDRFEMFIISRLTIR